MQNIIVRINSGVDSWKWIRETTKKREDYVKNNQRLKNYKKTSIRLMADFTTTSMKVEYNFKVMRNNNC